MATAKFPSTIKPQGSSELKQRLIFLVLALIAYRICSHVPVVGINMEVLKESLSGTQGGIVGLMNLFSGGALSRAAIVSLGITPYISASIVIQLSAMVVPSLAALQKEGESGRRKITQYTRYGTLLLAVIQSFFAANALEREGMASHPGAGSF